MHVCVCMPAVVCMWWSEDTLWSQVLSLCFYVSDGIKQRSPGLHGKCLYLPIHLDEPEQFSGQQRDGQRTLRGFVI